MRWFDEEIKLYDSEGRLDMKMLWLPHRFRPRWSDDLPFEVAYEGDLGLRNIYYRCEDVLVCRNVRMIDQVLFEPGKLSFVSGGGAIPCKIGPN